MAFEIELPTVLLLNTTGLIIGALVFLHVRHQSEKPMGLGLLALSFACLAGGSTIASLTDHLPANLGLWPHLSLLLGTLGYTLLWTGFNALTGTMDWRQSRWTLLLPAVIALLGLATGFPLDNQVRATVFHSYAIAALLSAAHAIQRQSRAEPLPTRPLLACSLVLSAAIYLLNLVNLHQDTDTVRKVANAFFFGIICHFAISLLTIALVNDRAQRHLRLIADTDPLTGVGNRRGFLAQLPPLPPPNAAVVLIDLDHFKRINDEFGHAGGDTVLVASAQLVQAEAPTDAVFARFGGEEFVLYLPDVQSKEAVETAERLRLRITELECTHEGQRIAVTASMGVAITPETGCTWQALLQKADQAMYAAKAAGRNGVKLHGNAQTAKA